MQVVLLHPEIPQNTGNIARSCVATGSSLTLVRPLGFSLSSRHFRRAGLDYLPHLDIKVVDTLEELLVPHRPFYFFSTRGEKRYTEIAFEKDALLIFGSESAGFPQEVWAKGKEHFYSIPMDPKVRSLNLSNAVAIVLYECVRQSLGQPSS